MKGKSGTVDMTGPANTQPKQPKVSKPPGAGAKVYPPGGRWTLRHVYGLSLGCEAHPRLKGVSLGKTGLRWCTDTDEQRTDDQHNQSSAVDVDIAPFPEDLAADWKLLPARMDIDEPMRLTGTYHRGPVTLPCLTLKGPAAVLGELLPVLESLGHTVLETSDFRRVRDVTTPTRGKKHQLVGTDTARALMRDA